MADSSIPQPMTDADVLPASDRPEPAAPLKTAHVSSGPDDATTGGTAAANAKQAVKDGASKFGQQAVDKVRLFADDGKARAGTALDQLSQLLTDAAGQVDDKVGAQYGQYARTAADQVSGLAETIRNKNVDELLDEARGFVRQSPAVAVGVAAALGFAVARVIQSGLDDNKA